MYKYLTFFDTPKITYPDDHTMRESIYEYISMKFPTAILDPGIKKIVVRGRYNRSTGISSIEKKGKRFNFKRPTTERIGNTIYVNCFPGKDYVFHYASMIKSYMVFHELAIEVRMEIPDDYVCRRAVKQTNLKEIPKVPIVIMGYVEGMEKLSSDRIWTGTGDFKWKHIRFKDEDAIILGCEFSYWGDIAGHVVAELADLGVKVIIYSGKVGSLNGDILPNVSLATGNWSIMPDGEIVEWDNLFKDIKAANVYFGKQATLPSVMQETKEWQLNKGAEISFVDSEIGHMARSAAMNGIQFSYLHVISDNLGSKFDTDLSNERREDVLANRKKLFAQICDVLEDCFNNGENKTEASVGKEKNTCTPTHQSTSITRQQRQSVSRPKPSSVPLWKSLPAIHLPFMLPRNS